MKKSMMLVAGMIAGAVVFAQENQGERRGHSPRESMKNVLMLDETQDATIRSINKKYAEDFAVLWHDSTQSREEKRQEIKSLRDKREKEINAVLTPEQNEKWKAHKEARAAQQKERMKKAIEKRDARMKAELSLTDEQAEKLKAARKDYAEKTAKLKAEHDAKVKSILTDEQLKKMKAKRSHQKHRRAPKKK
ncbi:MAG: hypothetical protein KIT62_06030 [Cyclobacteriaceae bacterium]|nr:hypothetical protein [Cyclobacteriaceae bacterium]